VGLALSGVGDAPLRPKPQGGKGQASLDRPTS